MIIAPIRPEFYVFVTARFERRNFPATGEEDIMKKFSIAIGIAAVAMSNAAIAHDTTIPFPSRGACESASAGMSNAEKDWLLAMFPDVFDTTGEVASFLTKAWTCDLNASDAQYYITDHRQDVLDSRWFDRRNH